MRTGVPCNENRFFPVRIALQGLGLHKGTIWQFPVQWIYYCHSYKSTGKKTGKTHLWSFLFEKIDGMMRWSHRKLLSLNLQILLKLFCNGWPNIGIEAAGEIIIEYSYFNLNLWIVLQLLRKVLSHLRIKSKYTIFNANLFYANFTNIWFQKILFLD